MTKDEALRMALEALEYEPIGKTSGEKDLKDQVITAIKEALAQPDKIALLKQKTESHDVDCLCADCTEFDDLEDATAQPEKDIPKIGCVNHDCDKCKAQPEQEPVAWMDIDEKGAASGLRYWHEPENRHEVPLYTTPPQRTWEGLTKIEAEKIYKDGSTFGEMMRMVEAKLKEKNT